MQTPSSAQRKSARPGRQARPGNEVAPLAAKTNTVHEVRSAALRQAEQGRIGDGLLMLRDAMEQQPSSHAVVSDIAALLMMARQHELAAHYALEALALQPGHGPSLYTLGFALAGMGDLVRAQEALLQLRDGPARDSLLLEAPALMPLVEIELRRLATRPH